MRDQTEAPSAPWIGRRSPALIEAGLPSPRRRSETDPEHLPDDVVTLEDLPSRVPVDELRAAHRRDVFWSGDWIDRGSPISWRSRSSVLAEWEQHGDLAAAEWPNGAPVDPEGSEYNAVQDSFRLERLAMLGALDQWRTATVEQIASMVGIAPRTVLHSRVAGALLGSGLADYGIPVAELARSRRLRVPHLPVFRPGLTKQFEKLVRPQVSYAELVAVTGGREFSASRQFDRHNILSTELGLRAAEFLPGVAAVIGEKLSRADLIFPGLAASQAGGDLTIVRDDGLRIVVELTASVSDRFRDKVDRWARLLQRYDLDSSGVVVLFVEAAKPDESARSASVLAQITKQVSRAASSHPGAEGRSAADRMFVASWSQLFPGPHMASDAFLPLRASCPAGPPTRGGVSSRRWVQRDLMDPEQVRLRPADPESLTSVAISAGMLAGSPFWLRSGRDVGVWNRMLDMMGVDRIPLRDPLTSVRHADGTWGPPDTPAALEQSITRLGRQAAPRLVSRGLPVVPLGSRLTRGVIQQPATGDPAWEGWAVEAPGGGELPEMVAVGFEAESPFGPSAEASQTMAADHAVDEIEDFAEPDPSLLPESEAATGENQ
ncbi:hypothetical protein [Brachybacterium paraconglomeratum]|uniref:hypothetical protein n=1 Tax=Brachybacterium paraconglomeratum TaxID=173362 RepID=UPI0022AE68E5|nr:hypothetical protein [Brachybacterium paraconglomeratum]MCZ4326727.1 hypothetical protein [Brachybacterium paraconglomeratum]